MSEENFAKAETGTKGTRNFFFTHYITTQEEIERILTLQGARYVLFGEEVCPKTGRQHLQGMACFKDAKTYGAFKRWFGCPGVHVSNVFNIPGAVTYCKKDNKWHESGVCPTTSQDRGAANAEKWEMTRKQARQGAIDEIIAEHYIKYYNTLKKIQEDVKLQAPLDDTTEQHLWFYGGTGTGKSRTAREAFPEAYMKMCNKWWDGYNRHQVIIIEDFDKNHSVLCHHLKIWGDRYPFLGEHKGGTTKIRPNLVIVTSNFRPEDIWTETCDLEPILRRYRVVRFGLDQRELLGWNPDLKDGGPIGQVPLQHAQPSLTPAPSPNGQDTQGSSSYWSDEDDALLNLQDMTLEDEAMDENHDPNLDLDSDIISIWSDDGPTQRVDGEEF